MPSPSHRIGSRTRAADAEAVPARVAATTAGRKVTYTRTVDTTFAAAEAIAKRNSMELNQVEHTFDVEHIAGPRGTNARWRFLIPGQMLVVSVDDLPIIEALIISLGAERRAEQRRVDEGMAS